VKPPARRNRRTLFFAVAFAVFAIAFPVLALAFLVVIPAGNLLLVHNLATLVAAERKASRVSLACLARYCGWSGRQQIPWRNDSQKSRSNGKASHRRLRLRGNISKQIET
jgi:hypothetical protein